MPVKVTAEYLQREIAIVTQELVGASEKLDLADACDKQDGPTAMLLRHNARTIIGMCRVRLGQLSGY